MALLIKIKSATLIEALVATVLIVIIFIIASLVLNNLVMNTFAKNTRPVENRWNELEYQIENNTIKLPYQENFQNWNIEITKEKIESKDMLLFNAVNTENKKIISKEVLYAEF